MKSSSDKRNNFTILLLCFMALFLSGCKWFDGDGKDVDTTAPVITMAGANPQTIEIDTAYTELGATAVDDKDGSITANIVIDASAVDTSTVGSYSVTYDVSDTAGNSATTQTRTVDVVADATPPVITLIGDNPQAFEVGTAYTELNATATDNIDGDISGAITIDASAVDTDTVGSYSVTYDVSDAAANAAATQTRTVSVVDTTIPVISLSGANPQTIEIDAAYTELGATAVDNYDGDISANIVIDTTSVDTSTEGSYNVTYNVSDVAGNDATTVTRTVNVGAPQATTFFTGRNETSGWELFITNGTEAGTVLLKDLKTEANSSSYPDNYLMINGVFYFTADNPAYGSELWKSDGTTEGTVLVKDIYTGQSNSRPRELTNVNGMLYFTADNGVDSRELWKSDGTEAGTVMVKDINTAGSSSVDELTDFNGTLLFKATTGTGGNQLWKSDGTEDGTVAVTTTLQELYYFTNVNGTLFFRASDGTSGDELWKSDGTEGGTMMIKDINLTEGSYPDDLINVNGILFFSADDGSTGHELWKSDGTEDGTVMIKDIYPGSTRSNMQDGFDFNGTLFFSADDGVNSYELWKSDGTEAGTVMVKNINTTGSSRTSYYATVNGKLLFSADDGINGSELWTSDGTESGTVMVKDIDEGANGSWPQPSSWFNQDKPIYLPDGRIIFGAHDRVNGSEPWVTDGTTEGTTLLKDINPGTDNGFYID